MRIIGEWIERFLEFVLSTAELDGSRDVVRKAVFDERISEGRLLRAVTLHSEEKVGVIRARERFSTGAFISPGAVQLRNGFGAMDVGAPAFDRVRFD